MPRVFASRVGLSAMWEMTTLKVLRPTHTKVPSMPSGTDRVSATPVSRLEAMASAVASVPASAGSEGWEPPTDIQPR